MRSVLSRDQFTPFGIWIREYLKDSRDGLSVTNLDYVFEDFHKKILMLVEEKTNGGHLGNAQKLTFQVIDRGLKKVAADLGYDYWGFYLIQLPKNATMIGPGVTINGKPISVEELQKHLNMERKFCEGHPL